MDAEMIASMMPSTSAYSSIYANVKRSSETQSEISSIDSDWSDIKSIAMQLGVANPDELVTQRFKVDRQKLENMIITNTADGGTNGAEKFFDTTMKDTSTYISWPCRLKIGAKTKKDPHVRIVGKPEDVSKAKERVLETLDSRGSRVTMKIDISYTDHSYIIGRGGSNIKRIMEETMTHIHFPDSNRSNQVEKSNQVSLCGSLAGVERARALVRASTPLIISFELPVMAPGRQVPDNDTQYVKDVESKFNIQVIFSTRPKLHSHLVLIKGSEKEAAKVQEATQLLINFMCESIANQIYVNLQLEISPQHHDIVKGSNNTQLLSIMERTKTKIIFPDVKDVNIKPIKKSQVTITGTIDGVYKARQQLIGNLPLALIFDYPDNVADTIDIKNLMNKYGVYVSLRQKSRQSLMSVVIKGVEKFVDNIYEARHEILKLTVPVVKPEIPATYFGPVGADAELAYRKSLSMLLATYPDSPLTPGMQMGSSNFATLFGQFHKYTSPSAVSSSSLQRSSCQYFPNVNRNSSPVCGTTNKGFLSVPGTVENGNVSPRNMSSSNTSGYHSFSSSTNSLEQLFPPYQPVASTSTGISNTTKYSPENAAFLDRENRQRASSSQSNTSNKSYYFGSQDVFNFDQKKIEGYKAMERPPQGEVRTPTSQWSALSLSKSSPFRMEQTNQAAAAMAWENTGESSPYNMSSTTGILSSTPNSQRNQLSHHKDIHTLMTHLGLDHYISTFVINEIDIQLFASLTPENLTELGITAFGPRKKMLAAISCLNASNISSSTSPVKFSAAPGAERRSSKNWQ